MAVMKNEKFTLQFDEAQGGVSGLTINGDNMEWIKQGYVFAIPRDLRHKEYRDFGFKLVDFSSTERSATAIFEAADMRVKTDYFFNEKGNVVVRNEITDRKDVELFLLQGQIGFNVCFYDDYKDSLTCVTSRCHTHIHCGGEQSWICLLKMGGGKTHLGVRVTKGGLTSYEQFDCYSNDRGYFVVHPELYNLSPDEKYVLEYEIFVHEGKEDFIKQLKELDGFPYAELENNTLFRGESCRVSSSFEIVEVYDKEKSVKFTSRKTKDGYKTTFRTYGLGEHKIELVGKNGKKIFSYINVSLPFNELVEKRVDYIINKQQYHKEGSALDGAFLIYDTEEGKPFFSNVDPDLNGTRERLAMGYIVAVYLQRVKNEKYLVAFKKYINFLLREIFDEVTGEVFSTVRRYSERRRLYNGPVLARVLLEAYYVLKDKQLLKYMIKAINFYYGDGGENFYPNGICMYKMLKVLEDAEMFEERETLKKQFMTHVGNVIKRGTNYPAHEVNYEQTIVSPAVSFIIDAYRITGDETYLKELKPHFELLEAFDGFQPHYKLNSIAIRFWDDYYAGKAMTFGDTMPQHCSSLSSYLYATYGALSGDERLYKKGITGLRNSLCLFFPDGSASCASIFPFRVNGQKGNFFDPFINDQDTVLYLAVDYLWKE